MEFLVNSILFILIWFSAISLTTAFYCDWGLCDSWHYCCDENVCCPHQSDNIWITVVIIIGVVFGMVLTGTCLYYNMQRIYSYLQRRYRGISPVTMPSEFESDVKSIKISY